MQATAMQNWLCPDLRDYWRLRKSKSSGDWILQGIEVPCQHRLNDLEGYALTFFSGQLTVAQVQQQCQRRYQQQCQPGMGDRLPTDFVVQLLQKLVHLGILIPTSDCTDQSSAQSHQPSCLPAPSHPIHPSGHAASDSTTAIALKPDVQWFQQRDGHWILGDPTGQHHLQVSPNDRAIIRQIGHVPLAEIPQRCQCSSAQLRQLLTLLAQGHMLAGVDPPKPPPKRFTPFKLLYFKKSFLNPDPWLSRHVDKLRWLWSRPALFVLLTGLSLTGMFAIAHYLDAVIWGQALLQAYGWRLFFPFGLLAMAVVSLHELAHAFTLKHFGGVVSDMGLLFMCLMPAAYTNSSDSYRVSRWQRCLVIGAGVICQIVIAAIAFWLWFGTAKSMSIHTGAYLLMVAALFTIALNLNPLARFDGYYLLSAATGINNLKGRSFKLYAAWLTRQPSPETGRDRWILAAYAPLSFLYLILIFGRLLLWLGNAVLTHIPYLALALLGLWLIYYYYPAKLPGER